MTFSRLAMMASVATLVSTGAWATPNGTIGFAPTINADVTTYSPGGPLSSATQITVDNSSGAIAINVDPTTYMGNPNQLHPASSLGTYNVFFGSGSTFTFYTDGTNLPTFTFANGNDVFTASSVAVTRSASTDAVSFRFTGSYTGSVGAVGTGNASVSLSFTQTGGQTGAVNYSGTFATPPLAVSEPGAAVVIGAGLLGLMVAARRRA